MATAEGGHFDAVALVPRPTGALALWSDSGGTHARHLGRNGAPAAHARRIGPPCPGGMDATMAGADVLVGCLAPVGENGVEARVLRLHQEETRAASIGTAGRYGSGVAVVAEGPRAWVAWHDGTPGRWRIRLASVHGKRLEVLSARTLSDPARAARSPSLALRDGRPVATWMESWIDEDGHPRGRLALWDSRDRVRTVGEVHWSHPLPLLASVPGGLLLGFRDLRDDRARAQLYLQRLAEDLGPEDDPVHIGRADGPGGVRLTDCGPNRLAVAPRTWAEHHLVTLFPLDAHFRPTGDEHHVYQWGSEYVRADGLCDGDRVTLLLAERSTRVRWKGRLVAAVVQMP